MKNHIKSVCPHGVMEARVTSNHKVVGSNPTGDFFYWYNLMIIYFNHPKQVCMTYLQHMLLSFRFSYLLCVGSIQYFYSWYISRLIYRFYINFNENSFKYFKEFNC